MKLENVIAKRSSKVIYRDGDKAIKVFDETYSQSDILNEALNQSRVAETGLPVPPVYEVSKIDGKWSIASKFVEGETLAALWEKNPDKTEEYIELFVKLQMEIHMRKSPLLNKLKDKMVRKMAQTALDDNTRYDMQTRLEGMPKHDKVCHGDFNPSNIIIDSNGNPYIIDWSHVTQGNASADVARSYLLFNLEGKSEIADKYLDAFCQKTGTEKRYVQQWLPIVAASQLVKGKPEEVEFLHRWIGVVDFE